MGIKNLDELREHAISALEKLSKGKISIEEAGATSKLCENIVSTLKLQLDLAKMLHREPKITFMGDIDKWKSLPSVPLKLEKK